MNDTKWLTTFVLSMIISGSVQAQAPAFPGAEGHGRYVTGGRGGKVVHVTNLNNDGAGSLRQAVKGSEKKIVVFDVAGVIALEKDLNIGANTTIEGQTAPRPGITVRYFTVRPGNNNIIRFIRFRRGEERNTNDGADCIWQNHVSSLILDHCSMSWSTDELGSFYDNNNFTMQWCMLGEGLNSGHSKGAHSYGGIWGGKLASFHHNFLGFVQNRAPRFCGARYNWQGYTTNSDYDKYQWKNTVQAENVDFRNCVMYNWGNGNGCYGGPGGGYINIVNNYYKAGPGTSNKSRVTEVSVADKGNAKGETWCYGMTSRYYIHGNYVTAQGSKAESYDWNGVKFDEGTYNVGGQYLSLDTAHYYAQGNDTVTYRKVMVDGREQDAVSIRLDGPGAPVSETTTHSAVTAYEKVLDYAGASLYRDAVDDDFAKQTRQGTTKFQGSVKTTTKGIIDLSTDDKNCYSEDTPGWGLTKTNRVDSDGDGMPDDWEKANGLNPNDPSDAASYSIDNEKQWYTNIEVYCNSLVEPIMKAENQDAESTVKEYYPKVNTPTGIVHPHAAATSAGSKYYRLNGAQASHSQQGLAIVVRSDDKGARVVEKRMGRFLK
jgi:hypothetical protein